MVSKACLKRRRKRTREKTGRPLFLFLRLFLIYCLSPLNFLPVAADMHQMLEDGNVDPHRRGVEEGGEQGREEREGKGREVERVERSYRARGAGYQRWWNKRSAGGRDH